MKSNSIALAAARITCLLSFGCARSSTQSPSTGPQEFRGTGGSDAASSSYVSDGSSGSAYIRQYSQMATSGDGSQSQSSSLSQPVLKGSTVLVFVTEYNIGGNPPGSAAPDPIAISDSENVAYTLLNTVNDQPDWQAVMSFARYNVDAGDITVNAHFVGLEWQALLVVEVANVPASPLIASVGALVMSANKMPDSVRTPTVAAGSSPALVVAFAVNSSDAAGAPNAGTAFTPAGTAWNWNGVEGTSRLPSSLLEYESMANPGNTAATFTPVTSGENFSAFAVALRSN